MPRTSDPRDRSPRRQTCSRSPERSRRHDCSRDRERKRDADKDRDLDSRRHQRSRSRSHPRERSRSRSRSRSRRHPRPHGHSRSRSPKRARSRSHDRVRDKGGDGDRKKRGRSESVSSRSSFSSDRDRKKRKKDKQKRRRSRSRDRKERKKSKRDKKKKAGGEASAAQWGKYGVISETDIYTKSQEFHTWLVEERKINPETISKDQSRKEFAKFAEDYNTATLPHEKYYHMEAYEKRMVALRSGEYIPPPDDSYDPQADIRAHSSRHKKAAVEHESYLSKEQLMELRRVQHERIEVGKMKLLGMDVKQNMGVRMDGTMFDG